MKLTPATVGWTLAVILSVIIFWLQFLPIVRYMVEDLSGFRLLVVLPVIAIFTLVFFGMAVVLLAVPIIFLVSIRKGVSV